jgi:precorrin-6B methylase 2
MELAQAEEIFNRLYDFSGHEIARAEKKRLGWEVDSFTYGEVVPTPFHGLLSQLSPQEDEVFIDLGSGTGKATLLAAMLFPFRRVIGVELLPGLAAAANKVLGRYDAEIRPGLAAEHQRQRIEFIEGNLLEVDLSEVDWVFTHATCFEPPLMAELARKLEELKAGAKAIIVGHQLKSEAFSLVTMKVLRLSWGTALTSIYQRQ